KRAGWRDLDHRSDVGRPLADGLLYDDSLRALHARALALGERFEDLFSVQGTRAFTDWLEGPAPWGGAHGINRYVFYRVARERPAVLPPSPDLDGPDGAGYVDWCWTFGRTELGILERFMPPASRAATTTESPGNLTPLEGASPQAAEELGPAGSAGER